VQLGRLVAGAEWRRPLAADWSGSVGFSWQRNKLMDERGGSVGAGWVGLR